MEEVAGSVPKEYLANKLALRRKLYGLKLKDNSDCSVQDHIKGMTELLSYPLLEMLYPKKFIY